MTEKVVWFVDSELLIKFAQAIIQVESLRALKDDDYITTLKRSKAAGAHDIAVIALASVILGLFKSMS